MRRTRPENPAQETRSTYESRWREVTLLVAYLVICLLSILTVLAPSTDNQEERVDAKSGSAMATGSVPSRPR
jgi:hypothetical protein